MTSGYAGKIVWVNLSNRKIREENSEKYQEWIGGRGLGSYILSTLPGLFKDEVSEQPVVIAAGPLVASGIPMGTRTAISARNLLSGGMCYSNVGGDFGTRLKMAGYDAVVIEGSSNSPIYIFIEESGAKILPADGLWGLKTSDLQKALGEKHGKQQTSYIGIGPAGESQSAIACLMVDRAHAAGWGGSGAIFGAKNLKAVVAQGRLPVKSFNAAGLLEKARQIEWRLNASEAAAGMVRGGTHGMAGAAGFSGLVPTGVKNLMDEYLSPEVSKPIREETFKQWETARVGCVGCAIRCLHTYKMESESYGPLDSEGMHANSVRGLGSNLGINRSDDLLKIHDLCNDYGFDVDGIAAVVGFALECAEHGILERQQPGNITLEWGDGPSIVKLIDQIADRQNLGAILSNGTYAAARAIGKGSERFAVTTKQVGINEQGIRSHRGWALGIITSTRGSGHLGGSTQAENRRISAEVGERIFGNRLAGDPQAYDGKGKIVAWTEGLKAIVDSLGLCYFMYGWYDLSLGNMDELAEMLYLATGIKMSGKDLHQQGIRVHSLERYLSHRLAGYTRKDDNVPDRFYDVPVSSGPYQGAHLDRSKVEAAKDEYYASLGWDVNTGNPSDENMHALKLDHIIGK